MELKLLSDQLNSAFEDVTTPQGNVHTLQDELMPSEPAFHGIHHFRFTRASPSFWKINVSVQEKMKMISNFLQNHKDNSIVVRPCEKFWDGENVEYIGRKRFEGQWEIQRCVCGRFRKELETSKKDFLCMGESCKKFNVNFDKDHHAAGTFLKDCFSDGPTPQSLPLVGPIIWTEKSTEKDFYQGNSNEEKSNGQAGPSRLRTASKKYHPYNR
eukprot:GHVP01021093.1.p1 GENE.GHVP01021093.1~~GHVP01021093.1.p1  ORF type:complete len:213 (+),score=35.46 GHVP01021093.1:170-808(+)